MMQDPISDMVSRIKNASMIGMQKVSMPYSQIKVDIADILVREGYVHSVIVRGDGVKKECVITLKYTSKFSAISDIKRLSKPGLRLYARYFELPKIQSGRGLVVISTPKGLMSGKEAYQKHLGGELICKIW
jgi:small subunit ribosomal protein S8